MPVSSIENKAVSVWCWEEELVSVVCSLPLLTQFSHNQFLSWPGSSAAPQSVWVKHSRLHSKHDPPAAFGPLASHHKMLLSRGHPERSRGFERVHRGSDSEDVQFSGLSGKPGKFCIFSIKVATPTPMLTRS